MTRRERTSVPRLAVVASAIASVMFATLGQGPASASIPTGFVLYGSGFGHGVGLSQYGAANMARDGKTAPDITGYYYTGSTLAAFQDDMDIKVNLHNGVNYVGFRSRAVDATPLTPQDDPMSPVEITVGDTVTVSAPGDSFSVRAANGALEVIRSDGQLVASGPWVTVRWSGTRYPGTLGDVPAYLDVAGPLESFGSKSRRYRYGQLLVTPTTTNGVPTMNVVNQVRLRDEYLYGVAEAPSSWPIEALKAQAIAARSYALVSVRAGNRTSCNCNLYDNVNDQVFAGWIKEVDTAGENWKAAVDQTTASPTQGQVIVSGPTLVKGYFFSSSGGRTQNSEEVWVSALPFLRSVDDPWSMRTDNPNRTWTANLPENTVATAFGLPDVIGLRVLSRTAAGGVKSIEATAPDGSVRTLSGETFRSRTKLKSTWIWQIALAGSAVPSPLPTGTTSPTPSPTPSPTDTGTVTPTPTPTATAPAVTLVANPAATINVPFVLSGVTSAAPAGSVVQRQVFASGAWSNRGTAVPVAADGTWKMPVTSDVLAAFTYRAVLRDGNGRTLATSNSVTVAVSNPKPSITITSQSSVTISEPFIFSGKAAVWPGGSVAQRQVLDDGQWENRGTAVPISPDGSWRMTATAPSSEQSMEFRALLVKDGRVVATSAIHFVEFVRVGSLPTVTPSPTTTPTPSATPSPTSTAVAAITVVLPKTVKVSSKFTMKGTAKRVPKGSTVIRQVMVGTTWTTRGVAVPVRADGSWVMAAVAPSRAQTMKFRYYVVANGRKIVGSSVRAITFVR